MAANAGHAQTKRCAFGWGFIKVASWEEVLNRNINPGRVFGPTLPLAQVADGYGAMDERRAIKALLRP